VTLEDGGLAVTGLDAAAIGDVAQAQGAAVHELQVRRSSLEDAYVDVTEKDVAYRAGVES
jgi:ABC-2 type transport system ATP-binding protein